MTAPRSASSVTFALLAAGMSVTGIGLLALLGWTLDTSGLTTWAAGSMPMGPSSAVLSVLFGVAVVLCSGTSPSPRAIRIATRVAWVGIVAGPLLVALHLLNVSWPAELLGLSIGRAFHGLPGGHVSPGTALCFVLANGSLLTLQSPRERGSWREWRVRVAAGLISAWGFGLVLTHTFGVPLLSGKALILPALNASLVFMIMGLTLLVLADRQTVERRASSRSIWQGRRVFAAAFVGVTAVIVIGCYAYYRQEEEELRRAAERQLETVSELKLSQLSQWRDERFGDAALMLRNASFSSDMRRLLERVDDAAARRRLEEWLNSSLAHAEYDQAFLLDVNGATSLSLPRRREPPAAAIARQASEVLRTGEAALLDFYVDEGDERSHLATLVPVLDELNAARPIGVLVLRIDPKQFLYPFITRWPTTSLTAETQLVRREGNEAVLLNDLRSEPDSALRYRLSLETTPALAVQAVLGQTGVAEGVDYLGAPVMGVLRPIPNSPWYLVVRMNTAELYAVLWQRLWTIAVFGGVLLFAAGSALGMVWRDQRARFYRKQVTLTEALRKSQSQLAGVVDSVDGIVWEADAETFQFTFVSPRAERLLGHPLSRWTAEPDFWASHIHPDDREQTVRYCQERTRDSCDHEFDYRMRAADGRYVWLRDIVTVAQENGRPTKLRGIMVDITEGRQAEILLRESEERLRLALSSGTQGLWDYDAPTGEVMVSPEYATMLGYDPAEFHETDAAWRDRLHPDDREAAEAAYRSHVDGSEDYRVEFRHRTKSGDWKWILSLGKLVSRTADGRPLRIIGTHTDITARKVAELRSQRLAQLYAAISQCNEAIVRGTSEAGLFPEVCHVAVAFGGVAMAWIGLTDEASRLVTPVASYGAGVEHLDGIRISVDADDPQGRGPTGTAIRESRAVWSTDVPDDPSTAQWHKHAGSDGWAASGALPLFRNGACIGALTIYAHAPDIFDDDGRTLLKEMAADISFALDHFAHDAARRAAEDALRESLERFQLANRATFNVLWDWDVRTDALWWNQNFLSTFGYRADEIEPGMESWRSRIHPEDYDRVETGIQDAVASRAETWSDQYRFRRADGAYAVVVDRGYINRDADGRAVRVIGAMEDITERERTEAKVANQLDELRRWYKATLGREGRVIEVKKEVNQLLARLGEPSRYPSAEHTDVNRDTANPQS